MRKTLFVLGFVAVLAACASEPVAPMKVQRKPRNEDRVALISSADLPKVELELSVPNDTEQPLVLGADDVVGFVLPFAGKEKVLILLHITVTNDELGLVMVDQNVIKTLKPDEKNIVILTFRRTLVVPPGEKRVLKMEALVIDQSLPFDFKIYPAMLTHDGAGFGKGTPDESTSKENLREF